MSTKKRVLITGRATASLLASNAFAGGHPTGYAGLNLGWNATNSETTATGLVNNGGANATVSDTSDSSLYGAAYGVVAGVKLPISTGYLALEANIADSSAESEFESRVDGTTIGASSLTSDLSYGVTGILATEVGSNTYVYGLAGYQMTTFEAKYTDRDVSTNAIASGSRDESFGGARVGAGIETGLTDALSLRLEWTQTYYSEETFAFDTITSTEPLTSDVKPTETRVTFGIIGHF